MSRKLYHYTIANYLPKIIDSGANFKTIVVKRYFSARTKNFLVS